MNAKIVWRKKLFGAEPDDDWSFTRSELDAYLQKAVKQRYEGREYRKKKQQIPRAIISRTPSSIEKIGGVKDSPFSQRVIAV